jgi:replicative DNA helicase
MNYGEMLLSKVIDTENTKGLSLVDLNHYPTQVEKEVHTFIQEYSIKNKGSVPSYQMVVNEFPSFTYYPNVTDSFSYLSSELKNYKARIELQTYLQNQVAPRFNTNQKEGLSIAEDIMKDLGKIIRENSTREKVGTSVKDGQNFLSEYEKRKKGESFTLWKSAFPTINRHVGGYMSGNMFVWYGPSGRGKSVFTTREAVEVAMQGGNVLVWSMEMSKYEVLVRIYSMVSALLGLRKVHIDGMDLDGGFTTRGLKNGALSEEEEEHFRDFLSKINDLIPGNIYIRAVDDDDFDNRSLTELEKDIEETKADFVVIDPFYYLDYEPNTTRTTGGDATNTSNRLRKIAGRTKTAIIAITQAEEAKVVKDEAGKREIAVPDRSMVKKTKSLLEDCAQLFAIDTADGLGVIEINKSRDESSENIRTEILFLPSHGIIREPTVAESQEKEFAKMF